MRLAVLSDLHGNLAALRAVEAAVVRLHPDMVLVLGDMVGYLTRPNQVTGLVRDWGWHCLAGNYDLAVLTGGETGIDRFLKPGIGPEPREVFAWTQKQVNESTRRFLAALPGQLRFTLEGRRVLACHGSPRNVREYLYPDHPLEDLDRMMTRHQADLLFCGHTHRPFVRATSQGLAVNPGSVGKPKDGDPRASWALVEVAREVSANIMRVEYDLEQEARRLRQAGLPAGTVERLLAGT